jgi:predicted restriction endonuclease
VASGGYEDDEDYGSVIIYTGHGGRDQDSGRQVGHQSLEDSGNAALVRSHLEGAPVRVIRGAEWRDSAYAPREGYRYDGLFLAESFWCKTRRDGFKVWQFRLVSLEEPMTLLEQRVVSLEPSTDEAGPAPRRTSFVQRAVRNTAVIQQVKRWHENRCQMCRNRLELPGGFAYSEGAHIQALGRPHCGPDVTENVLCLCPSCHVLFDNGARFLSDDLDIIDGLSRRPIGELQTHRQHRIEISYVRRHRGRWVA